jgi:2-amino-4-hydroxy-6-hydroxymethyldihydropteridine diphosphokinase
MNCLFCSLAFDCFQATAIEIEELIDIVLGLGSGSAAETGGGDGGAADAGNSGNEFHKIESDIFITAQAVTCVVLSIHCEVSPIEDATRKGDDNAAEARASLPLNVMRTAYIGMGANLPSAVGRPELTLAAAAERLGMLGRVVARSSLYSTAPVGFVNQPRFVNAVVALEIELEPLALLDALMTIEREFGRDRSAGIANGPRTLDLDILLIEGIVVSEPRLVVPHPRLAERAFALVPLNEIAPEALDPRSGLTVAQWLERLFLALPDANYAVFQIENNMWRAGGADRTRSDR